MCTGLTLETKDGYHLFGRNMDIEYDFNQSIHVVPRNFKWTNRITGETHPMKHAIIGMATTMEGHPLFADGMNEKGLCCAGLNFPGYALYDENITEGNINIGPYDLILWVLSSFETIAEVKAALGKVTLVNKNFAPYAPIPPLHWIAVDKTGDCIVIEKTKEKLNVFNNTIGVLSNSPTFDWHVTNLRQYMGLQSTQPKNTTWHKEELKPLGQGVGLIGLPGDFTPASRFLRTAYLKSQDAFLETKESAISQFYHILNNVAMVGGSVVTPEEKNDITRYTACMCQETGVYYYNTYSNNQLNAIELFKENLDGTEVKTFECIETLNINYQN